MSRRGRLYLALAAVGIAIGAMVFAGTSPRSLPVDAEPEPLPTTAPAETEGGRR